VWAIGAVSGWRAAIGAGMLTGAERGRFAVWCEERVYGNEGLLVQLAEVPGVDGVL
jgi:hypothetical protein